MSWFFGCMSLLVLLQCNTAAAQGNGGSKGPSIAETNRKLELGDGYRRLVASSLKLKTPTTTICSQLLTQIKSLTHQQMLVDPAKFNGNELALINAQQHAEEDNLARLAQFSRLVHETVERDCFILPPH